MEDFATVLARLSTEDLRKFYAAISSSTSRHNPDDAAIQALRAIGFA